MKVAAVSLHVSFSGVCWTVNISRVVKSPFSRVMTHFLFSKHRTSNAKEMISTSNHKHWCGTDKIELFTLWKTSKDLNRIIVIYTSYAR